MQCVMCGEELKDTERKLEDFCGSCGFDLEISDMEDD